MTRQELTNKAVAVFRRSDYLLKRYMEKRVSNTGVFTSQHRFLMELNASPCSSQGELAEIMDVSAAAVAVSLKKLERGGYIERITDAADNRVHQVTITDKGKEVIKQSFRIFKETDEAIFEGFTDEEVAQTRDYLARMQHNLEQMNHRYGQTYREEKRSVSAEGNRKSSLKGGEK